MGLSATRVVGGVRSTIDHHLTIISSEIVVVYKVVDFDFSGYCFFSLRE